MSELEKIRAVRLLSVIGVALLALFAVRGIDPDTALPARDALEICAVSKGALCEGAAVVASQPVRDDEPRSDLAGVNFAVTALHATGVNEPAPVATLGPITVLGSITVVATRLPADRFAQLDTLHREAAALTDPDNFEAAHVFAF